MKPYALFTDSDNRDTFMRAVGTDVFVTRGQTFAHFAAIKIAVWADMDVVYEDAGTLMAHELALTDEAPPKWVLDSHILAQCPTLQMEVRKALIPNQAKVQMALSGDTTTKLPRYTIPTGTKLRAIYNAILRELLDLTGQDLECKIEELREYREEYGE